MYTCYVVAPMHNNNNNIAHARRIASPSSGAGGVASCLGMLDTRFMEELATNHIIIIIIIAATPLTPCVGGWGWRDAYIKGAILLAGYRE